MAVSPPPPPGFSQSSQLRQSPINLHHTLHANRQTVVPPEAPQPKPFLIYHDSFLTLLGANPTLQCLIDDPRAPYFHEAGVFHPPTNTLFITSNQLDDPSPDAITTRNKTIVVTKIEFFSPTDFTRDKVRCPERNYMALGGTNYRDGLILCAQGSLREPSGLVYMEAKRPHKTITLLNNYHSRPFNSPSDVIVHSDGSIWFTDPIYGYELGFRPRPQLPQLVYRFDPIHRRHPRRRRFGFGRPNGLTFSPRRRHPLRHRHRSRPWLCGPQCRLPPQPRPSTPTTVYWEHDSPLPRQQDASSPTLTRAPLTASSATCVRERVRGLRRWRQCLERLEERWWARFKSKVGCCRTLFWEERGDVVFWGDEAVAGAAGDGDERGAVGDLREGEGGSGKLDASGPTQEGWRDG